MRAVIQRVRKASVIIDDKIFSSIQNGLVVLIAVEENDTADDIKWLAQKIVQLRIFSNAQDLMNLNIHDINGEILIVSQFTLFASTKKGNRPSFIRSAKPDIAIPVYEEFVKTIEQFAGKKIKTGQFGATMQIELINDGPVTIIIDSKNKE